MIKRKIIFNDYKDFYISKHEEYFFSKFLENNKFSKIYLTCLILLTENFRPGSLKIKFNIDCLNKILNKIEPF